MRRSCWTCVSFPRQDIKQVPLLARIVWKLLSYRNKINRVTGEGLEITIEITFVGKVTVTEWLKKALHRINIMIEEKVLM